MPVVAATAYPTSATAVPVSFRVMQVRALRHSSQ
jgi:hypothetical protein